MNANLVLFLSLNALRVIACPNDCSFKGTCNIYNQCECFAGFTDADCSRRHCPEGPSWAAPAVSVDTGHNILECSAAGMCNRRTGECECFEGFVGSSCQRLACPASGGVVTKSLSSTTRGSCESFLVSFFFPFSRCGVQWAWKMSFDGEPCKRTSKPPNCHIRSRREILPEPCELPGRR
jgi:hypothetical protein